MKVVLAEYAGFCYGVRRALDTVTEAEKTKGKPMFILGPLIHNPQVIERLDSDGVKSVKSLSDIPAGSIVVMPSHGVPRQTMVEAADRGLEIIDVTCPFVGKVHRLADDLVNDGYQVVVLGDKEHTEVRGILSECRGAAVVVSDPAQVKDLNLTSRVGIVAQTTQTVERYRELVAEIAGWVYEVRAYKTICNATMERQAAALDLTGCVDVMLVVGGKNSANTRRLAEICAESGVPTHHIEVAAELEEVWFSHAGTVGVSAGASTPDWLIHEVIERVEQM
jgi:4-hydroxy-3-methylbut-2-enyl diphosphate reductase